MKKGMSVELRRVRSRSSEAAQCWSNAVCNSQDPYNVTDKNAIEVRHARGGQRIGYLKKELAARLSNLVKERKIRLEAVAGDGSSTSHPRFADHADLNVLAVPFNTVGLFEVPMRLEIWGKRKFASDSRLDWLSAEKNAQRKAEKLKAEALKAAMEDVEATEGRANGDGKGGTASGGPHTNGYAGGKSKQEVRCTIPLSSSSCQLLLTQIEREIAMRQSILLARQNKGDMLGDMFKEGAMDPASLPVHPCPPGRKDGTMRADLLPFQVSRDPIDLLRLESPLLMFLAPRRGKVFRG